MARANDGSQIGELFHEIPRRRETVYVRILVPHNGESFSFDNALDRECSPRPDRRHLWWGPLGTASEKCGRELSAATGRGQCNSREGSVGSKHFAARQ